MSSTPLRRSRHARRELDQRRRARTRARVLEAAERVLATEGLDAPVPAIARAAGVGVGSVYRHFPSKEALVDAVVVDRLSWYAERAEAAALEPDAWIALVDLIVAAAERQSVDALLTEALETVEDHAEVKPAIAHATGALDRLLARAREQGTLRPDVTTDDLRLVFVSVGAVIASPRTRPESWRRLVELITDGMRASPGAPSLRPLPPAA